MTIYPLDASGLLTSNLISGEIKNIYDHQATPGGGYYYYVIPDGAPFFADTLNFKALKGSTQVDLIEGLDYYLGLPFVLGMYLIGRPLYGAIVFRSSIDNLKLVMSYQTLGGAWITTPEKIINPDLPTSASNFGGLSTSFDGPATGTVIGDPLVYGGDPQTVYTDLFAKITNNNYNPKTTSWDMLLDVLPDFPKNCYGRYNTGTADQNALIAELQKFQDNFTNAPSQAKYITHLVDYNNPHATNKAKLGLDLLENLPWATDTEVVAQATVRKLVTLRQALMLKGVVDPSQLSTATDAVKGPSTVYINTTTPYLINNFDFRETYTIEAVNGGSVSLVGEYINYKAPNTPGVYGFKINGALFPIGAVVGGINLSFEKAPNVTADDIATHIYTDTTVTIDITNYDVGVTYDCSVSDGHVTQSGSKILVTAPSSPGDIILTVNQEPFTITVVQSFVNPPTILSPDATSQISAGSNFTVSASPFSSTGYQDTQYSAYWEIASDANFGNIVAFSLNDVVNLNTYQTNLADGGTYYARVKYQGNKLAKGAWSDAVSFTVIANTPTVYPFFTIQTVFPTDLVMDDYSRGNVEFGYGASMSGDGTWAASIAPLQLGSSSDAGITYGVVYLYKKTDTLWNEVSKIHNEDITHQNLNAEVLVTKDGSKLMFMSYYLNSTECYGKINVYHINADGSTAYLGSSPDLPLIAVGNFGLSANPDGSKVIVTSSCGIDGLGSFWSLELNAQGNGYDLKQSVSGNDPTIYTPNVHMPGSFGIYGMVNDNFDRLFITGNENISDGSGQFVCYLYFFKRVNGTWVYQTKQEISTTSWGNCGCNAAGDIVVTGAGYNQLQVLTCDGNTFLSRATLTDPRSDSDSTSYSFATRIQLSDRGDVIAIGEGRVLNPSLDQVNIYVSTDNLVSWPLAISFDTPADGGSSTYFASIIAMARDGSSLMSTAANYSPDGTFTSGAVYFYQA
jgi:hypothetical protein